MDHPHPTTAAPPAEPTAQMRIRRLRTLNEIAFIAGDGAHGGPPREAELAALRSTLRLLDEAIAAADRTHREDRCNPQQTAK